MKYLLAIDGGGSKTHALCCDEQGHELGEGLAGATSLTATEIGAASFNLQEVIRQATQNLPPQWRIEKMVMGLAGIDTQAEIDNAAAVFKQSLQYLPIGSVQLVNDILVALESGTNNPNAVALIAGTGSNCYGRTEEGQEAKTGGMDFLLTDEGSGYAIGRAVLRAAVKSFDGRGPKTILENAVVEHFHLQSINELKTVVYHPLLNKTEVGELSKMCTPAVEQGDIVSVAIFDKAVEDLYIMVRVVLEKLDLLCKNTDCVLVGGMTKIPYIQDHLKAKLGELCPQLVIQIPEKPPVYGALKLAMRA